MSTARDQLANIALAHIGCSSKVNIQIYSEVIIRPSDRTPSKISYFLGYYGGKPPSTCALFVLGIWRLAGMTDEVLLDPYKPGAAMGDVQVCANHHGALSRSNFTTPFSKGDAWIIDNGTGMDAHVGICVSDATVNPDGSFEIDTVEGGQGPDSSGIQKFTRKWIPKAGKWYNGLRFLIVHVDASKLGIAHEG